ncbi:MAG TPA: pirin family protein [Verrucomicrobiota bacterium]|nr:quercetin 2,3-dioxygenase [Verrucomicrobiales bacterium]HRI11650.1 pirin family protein [Verrucomicrobiota bacterium]
MMTIRKSEDRGYANHGWLNARHSFSFAGYHDPAWMGFRTLRVLNDDIIAGGGGFGTHPHRDMEIITYILSGALEHRDSMGNGRVIRPGEVQYMAAGTGVQHSEFNHSPTEPAHLLQIWIVPDRKNAKPAYAERSFAKASTGRWHLVASKTGREQSIGINQDADVYLAKLEAGDSVKHQLASGRHGWVQVAEGEITLNGENLKAGDAAALSETPELTVKARSAAQVLLFDLN